MKLFIAGSYEDPHNKTSLKGSHPL